MRIPEEYTAPPPSTTLCLLSPQVGALLSNLTKSQQAPYLCPHPPLHTHLPTHLPTHMCTMRGRRRAPDLPAPDGDSTKQGAEGWGPAFCSRAPSPSTRVQGPGPSRGTRLGLISGAAPSPNGLQLHKHSQNSEPALSGAAQASAPAFLDPSPPSLGQLLRNSSNWQGIESQSGFSRGGGYWHDWGWGWGGEQERREKGNKL